MNIIKCTIKIINLKNGVNETYTDLLQRWVNKVEVVYVCINNLTVNTGNYCWFSPSFLVKEQN